MRLGTRQGDSQKFSAAGPHKQPPGLVLHYDPDPWWSGDEEDMDGGRSGFVGPDGEPAALVLRWRRPGAERLGEVWQTQLGRLFCGYTDAKGGSWGRHPIEITEATYRELRGLVGVIE